MMLYLNILCACCYIEDVGCRQCQIEYHRPSGFLQVFFQRQGEFAVSFFLSLQSKSLQDIQIEKHPGFDIYERRDKV